MSNGEDIFKKALRDMLDGPLGDDAVYSPSTGEAKTIRIFYHKESLRELGMDGYRIWAEAMTEDVAGILSGESLTARGVAYRIKEPPQDGDDYMSIIDLSID